MHYAQCTGGAGNIQLPPSVTGSRAAVAALRRSARTPDMGRGPRSSLIYGREIASLLDLLQVLPKGPQPRPMHRIGIRVLLENILRMISLNYQINDSLQICSILAATVKCRLSVLPLIQYACFTFMLPGACAVGPTTGSILDRLETCLHRIEQLSIVAPRSR